MKRILTVLSLLLLLGLLVACGGAEAENELEAIREEGKMVVGTSADYPPFESVDDQGNFVGFDIELIREIGDRMDVEVEIQDMPFDSLIAAVQEDKIDLAISAFNYTEERDQTVDFTEPYYYGEDGILVASDFAGTIEAPEDLANYVVGTQTGTTQDAWVQENLVDAGLLPAEDLFRYERVDQAALDLQSGRIDAILVEDVVAESLVNEMDGLHVAYTGEVSSGPVNIVVPEGATELQQALNDIIAELQSEGVVDNLIIKYMQ